MRNSILATTAAVFAVLCVVIIGNVAYVSAPILIGLAIAFLLLGIALVILTVRGNETGKLRFFLILAGACATAMPVLAVLHNFFLHAFLFILALLVLPFIFLVAWSASVILLAVAEKPVSAPRKLLISGVCAFIAAAIVPVLLLFSESEGYEVTSQVLASPQEEVRRVFVTAEVDGPLMDVVYHSFEHSLVSAFESNGIAATVHLTRGESEANSTLREAVDSFAPDAILNLSIKPLFRIHREGYEVVVGTIFVASLNEARSGEPVWQISGKVDYVTDRFFDSPGYRTSYGMKQEFAWSTTAAIVRTFMLDLYDRESEPIYTVTEQRKRKGQRTD